MPALRLAVRELRGSAGGFVFLLVGIAFGTAAIAAIELLSAAVLDGMRDCDDRIRDATFRQRRFERSPSLSANYYFFRRCRSTLA